MKLATETNGPVSEEVAHSWLVVTANTCSWESWSISQHVESMIYKHSKAISDRPKTKCILLLSNNMYRSLCQAFPLKLNKRSGFILDFCYWQQIQQQTKTNNPGYLSKVQQHQFANIVFRLLSDDTNWNCCVFRNMWPSEHLKRKCFEVWRVFCNKTNSVKYNF